jgi:hypothetical protein
MADVARLTKDEEMFAACERLWNSITKEKLYVTGGIGATHMGEAFSYPYDLPNDTAYSETCAAIGLAFFARRMLEIKADRRYGDVMEQALYNTVLAGMALDGKSFFYVNPLEVVPEGCKRDERKQHVKPVRQKWFGCACCPPNIARIVSSIGAYVCTAGEDTLYTHLYAGGTLSCVLNGKRLDVKMESAFPWEGEVKAELHADEAVTGTLAFRIPGWCKNAAAEVTRGGKTLYSFAVESAVAKENISFRDGYLYLTEEWQDGDEILLHLPMEVRCVRANALVREDAGKVAFVRGPICYCMEEADNGKNLHLLKADLKKLYQDGKRSTPDVAVEKWFGLGHEMCILKVPGRREEALGDGAEPEELYADYAPAREKETTLTFVPYYAWANRGEGEMSVWVRITE